MISNLISGDINSGTTSNYQKMSSPVKLRLDVKTSRANQNGSKMIKVDQGWRELQETLRGNFLPLKIIFRPLFE